MPMLKAALNFSKEISEEIEGVEHPDDEGHQQEHDEAADTVEDGNPASRRQTIGREVGKGVDVAELGPLGTLFGGQLCHF